MKRYCFFIFSAFVFITIPYVAWLLARMCIGDYFTIPTESMMPTLQPGDKVVVNKLIMGARIYTDLHFEDKGQELKIIRTKGIRDIRHNDIAVFNFANHNGKLNFVINHVYCKRVVGLPGDSVSAHNGHYKNNNYIGTLGIEEEQKCLELTPDSLIQNFWIPPYYSIGWNIRNFGPYYVPRKGDIVTITAKEGALYQLQLEWELGTEISWDWEKNETYSNGKLLHLHTFQHNYYFMAGDNVMNSLDSRYWGLVPEEYIVGIVDITIRDNEIINPYTREI